MNFETEVSKLERPSLSLCICTMNRPNDLDRCLASVFKSQEKPDEIIVSDDSPDNQPTQVIVANYSEVIYQQGPRRGLGPNRNACIRRARGSYLIFIDDDVCISPKFFLEARRLLTLSQPKTIITGYELNHQQGQTYKVVPHNADFWGFQQVPVQNDYRAIVINATIFPKTLFEQALFDERLRYGSEEIDMAQHAIALGYLITYAESLYVNHYPSPINREYYKQFIQASRLYATMKAYWQYDRSVVKTLTYILLAPLHLIGSSLRRRDVVGVWKAFQAITLASRYFLTTFQGINSSKV